MVVFDPLKPNGTALEDDDTTQGYDDGLAFDHTLKGHVSRANILKVVSSCSVG